MAIYPPDMQLTLPSPFLLLLSPPWPLRRSFRPEGDGGCGGCGAAPAAAGAAICGAGGAPRRANREITCGDDAMEMAIRSVAILEWLNQTRRKDAVHLVLRLCKLGRICREPNPTDHILGNCVRRRRRRRPSLALSLSLSLSFFLSFFYLGLYIFFFIICAVAVTAAAAAAAAAALPLCPRSNSWNKVRPEQEPREGAREMMHFFVVGEQRPCSLPLRSLE